MATTAKTHIPVEAYLRSSFEPDAEYVDGVIEERPVASTVIPHGRQPFSGSFFNMTRHGTSWSAQSCACKAAQPSPFSRS